MLSSSFSSLAPIVLVWNREDVNDLGELPLPFLSRTLSRIYELHNLVCVSVSLLLLSDYYSLLGFIHSTRTAAMEKS